MLKLGLASTVLLAVAGGGVVALSESPIGTAGLQGRARDVMRAVGQAVLDGSLPQDSLPRAAALDELLKRVDALVLGLPAHAQAELSQLLALLATPGARRLLVTPLPDWSEASVAQVQVALQDMRMSSLELRQQAYHALHDIVGGAYFSGSETWGVLGYPGPRVLAVPGAAS